MGAILIGLGLAVMSAAAALIAGCGIGLALATYVAGGVLGTLTGAGWAALRVPRYNARRLERPLVLRLD